MEKLIKKGELVLVTAGDYSDYSIQYAAEALIDIDIVAVQQAYLNVHKVVDGNTDGYNLAAFLQSQGYLKPRHIIEWHLEDYGKIDEMWLGEIDG